MVHTDSPTYLIVCNRLKAFIDSNIGNIQGIDLLITGSTALVLNGLVSKEITDIDLFFTTNRIHFVHDAIIPRIDTIFSGFLCSDVLDRCSLYYKYKEISIFVLSIEDVLINKVSGYNYPKHKDCIVKLFTELDKNTVSSLINTKLVMYYHHEAYKKAYEDRLKQFKTDFCIQ